MEVPSASWSERAAAGYHRRTGRRTVGHTLQLLGTSCPALSAFSAHPVTFLHPRFGYKVAWVIAERNHTLGLERHDRVPPVFGHSCSFVNLPPSSACLPVLFRSCLLLLPSYQLLDLLPVCLLCSSSSLPSAQADKMALARGMADIQVTLISCAEALNCWCFSKSTGTMWTSRARCQRSELRTLWDATDKTLSTPRWWLSLLCFFVFAFSLLSFPQKPSQHLSKTISTLTWPFLWFFPFLTCFLPDPRYREAVQGPQHHPCTVPRGGQVGNHQLQ